MANAKRANDLNSVPCWKVRLCIRGCAILHLLSKEEPVVQIENGKVMNVYMDLITDTEHGDILGFVDWQEVSAISWRFAPLASAS